MEDKYKVVDPFKAIYSVIKNKGLFSIFLGAGTSIEAKVPTAEIICQNIASEIIFLENKRREARSKAPISGDSEIRQWLNQEVNWDDEENRYSSCVKYLYTQQSERVDYFRELLHGKNPSFTHYATALLMHQGYLAKTCISTNFDKLLEKGFSELNIRECQAIRLAEEAQYWKQEDDKCYCLKLHGDYDTHNVLNTFSETTSIQDTLIKCTEDLLNHSGLLILGSAGREKSIHTLLDRLTTKENLQKGLLDYGILWGVHIGNSPPDDFSPATLEKAVSESIKNGAVGKEIVKLMNRLSTSDSQFGFFPIWGSGRFFWELIKLTEDKKLLQLAEPFLDHEMRVTEVFKRAGLSDNASKEHLKQLRVQQERVSRPQQDIKSEIITEAQLTDNIKVTIAYGDISSDAMLNITGDGRCIKALVSPDDTCLSVGGGAALAIVQKGGLRKILFELSKFSPISLADNVVTSGGLMPVHYIIHAAGVEIIETGAQTSPSVIKNAARQAIERAMALGVECLWLPLLGAGVAQNDPKTSFESILKAIQESATSPMKGNLNIIIAIFNQATLERDSVKHVFQSTFPKPTP